MSITIERAPIVVASFLEQTYTDDEYYRRFKPNGKPYTLDDDLGHFNCHLGNDMQRLGRADDLYAVKAGQVEHVDLGAAFGLQIALRTEASGYREAAFYAHCQTRVADGTRVRAGDKIGRMGTTGGVEEHLHFGWLADWTRHDTWRNPSAALRALKAQLGGDDDVTDADIAKIAAAVEAKFAESDNRLRLDLSARAVEHEKIRSDLAARASEHVKLQADMDKVKAKLGIS